MLTRATSELKRIAQIDADSQNDALDNAARDEFVRTLRDCLKLSNDAEEWATRAIKEHQRALPPTSRAGYLQVLDDLIGPPPQSASFREEWVELRVEACTHACTGRTPPARGARGPG